MRISRIRRALDRVHRTGRYFFGPFDHGVSFVGVTPVGLRRQTRLPCLRPKLRLVAIHNHEPRAALTGPRVSNSPFQRNDLLAAYGDFHLTT